MLFGHDWPCAVLAVLHACVSYFCTCTCSAQLSMFHTERWSRNTITIIIVIKFHMERWSSNTIIIDKINIITIAVWQTSPAILQTHGHCPVTPPNYTHTHSLSQPPPSLYYGKISHWNVWPRGPSLYYGKISHWNVWPRGTISRKSTSLSILSMFAENWGTSSPCLFSCSPYCFSSSCLSRGYGELL